LAESGFARAQKNESALSKAQRPSRRMYGGRVWSPVFANRRQLVKLNITR
jgi:hypothetical protein